MVRAQLASLRPCGRRRCSSRGGVMWPRAVALERFWSVAGLSAASAVLSAGAPVAAAAGDVARRARQHLARATIHPLAQPTDLNGVHGNQGLRASDRKDSTPQYARRLLRALPPATRRRCREKRDEVAASHSVTSSARPSNVSGKLILRACAVCRVPAAHGSIRTVPLIISPMSTLAPNK